MNYRAVFHVISHVLAVVAIGMAACGGLSLLLGDSPEVPLAFGSSALITLLIGGLLWLVTRGSVSLTRREGFSIVALGWLAASLFGALPYWSLGPSVSYVDAFFETMSGFTTTGATIYPHPELLPRGLLLWRALIQWLGGMGVLVLCVAILPFLGVGALQIFRAEIPGPSKERLAPRIATTAKLLWGVYVLLTGLQIFLLWIAGMHGFEAVCHSFSTVATGGFSTRAASIRAFQNPWIEWIVILFMFLAGVNFSLHYAALRGRWAGVTKDGEFRWYAGILAGSILLLSIGLWNQPTAADAGQPFRAAAFQATSIMTTTGFATRDFNLWPASARLLLLGLMFIGGCSGSTGGGMKVVRFALVVKGIRSDIRGFFSPHAISPVRMVGVPVPREMTRHALGFAALFIGLFAVATALMSFYAPDLKTAASAVIACLGNIGPGLGAVGPTETYAWIPAPGKILLSFCMLAGRLELYTVMVLLMPRFWRQ